MFSLSSIYSSDLEDIVNENSIYFIIDNEVWIENNYSETNDSHEFVNCEEQRVADYLTKFSLKSFTKDAIVYGQTNLSDEMQNINGMKNIIFSNGIDESQGIRYSLTVDSTGKLLSYTGIIPASKTPSGKTDINYTYVLETDHDMSEYKKLADDIIFQ